MRMNLIPCVLTALIAGGLFGCAETPNKDPKSEGCPVGENLILDTGFEELENSSGLWRYSQHAGERSFSVEAREGVLQIQRIAGEPWMLLQQTIESNAFAGAKIKFSAELKGNAPVEPRLHGFEHKAGLYLNIGHRRDPSNADHEPNSGAWDWQTVSVERAIPLGEKRVHVGFLHQSGGTLWVRKPALTIIDCSPD